MTIAERNWWKEQVIYQIYPRSFQDTTGNGIGDLNGILSRLDYLSYLGVDVIWLGPVYPSPNDDNGYDISDYKGIHPDFGTMADFEHLLAEVHRAGMKLIMDLVVNHSSDEHPWFKSAVASKESPYRDYYIWEEGKASGPPNNWVSFFEGPAWTLDEKSGEYYLHLFGKKQPDLNWENELLRKEIQDVARFWLDKGIDGFRMDVISLISKPQDFADAPYEDFVDIVDKVYANGPRVHEFMRELHDEVFCHYDMIALGEGAGINPEEAVKYTGKDRGELNMIFQFDHMHLDFGKKGRFDPVAFSVKDLKDCLLRWDAGFAEDGWQSIFLDNHDFARMISRFGDDSDQYRGVCAKLFSILLLTQRGTPCIYQGSEIGMRNTHFDSLEECRDLETFNYYRSFKAAGMSDADFLAVANQMGRDTTRSPMPWNEDENAGFTQGTPWIKMGDDVSAINVQSDVMRADSILRFYRGMLRLRKEELALVYGSLVDLPQDNASLFVYKRVWSTKKEELLVVLNMSSTKQAAPDIDFSKWRLLIANCLIKTPKHLSPWEGRVYKRNLSPQ